MPEHFFPSVHNFTNIRALHNFTNISYTYYNKTKCISLQYARCTT